LGREARKRRKPVRNVIPLLYQEVTHIEGNLIVCHVERLPVGRGYGIQDMQDTSAPILIGMPDKPSIVTAISIRSCELGSVG